MLFSTPSPSVDFWDGNQSHRSAVFLWFSLALSLTHCLLIINQARHRNRSLGGIGRWAHPKIHPHPTHFLSRQRTPSSLEGRESEISNSLLISSGSVWMFLYSVLIEAEYCSQIILMGTNKRHREKKNTFSSFIKEYIQICGRKLRH